MWLYLEGGQIHGASVLTLENVCYDYQPWSLYLLSATSDSDPSSFTFTLEDIYRQVTSVTKETYKEHEWFHLAVIHSSKHLRLFVNGIGMNSARSMPWTDYTTSECLLLRLGSKKQGFRGKMRSLRILSSSYSSSLIKQLSVESPSTKNTWVAEDFFDVKGWFSQSPPTLLNVILETRPSLEVSAPPCGKTVCDDAKVISAYTTNPNLMGPKTVNMEIVYFANSDGSSPGVTALDLENEIAFLQRSFLPWNITLIFSTRVLKNTHLNHASLMVDCTPSMIGDGHCDDDCDFPATNNDGGDCLPTPFGCSSGMRQNGVCDADCNIAYFDFDSSDCCQNGSGVCFDPSSPNRGYLHLSEIRDIIKAPTDKLSIVLVNWLNPDMLGIASMPWEHNSDALFGSVVASKLVFSSDVASDTIVHEVGHVLGLWHVHHGISEMSCTDKCLEREASLLTGDLCEDTSPSARHTQCNDPTSGQQTCSVAAALINTPFKNFMSYASGTCSSEKTFTRQQGARMHCYLDLVHSRTLSEKKASATPLSVQVQYADSNSVTLTWLPPFRIPQPFAHCAHCLPNGAFLQYAAAAEFSGADKLSLSNDLASDPRQATGPPDAAPCARSPESWLPTLTYNKLYRCDSPCPFSFSFDTPVKVDKVSIWIGWYSNGGDSPVHKVQLISPNGSIVADMAGVHPQCDKPFTKTIYADALVNKVVVFALTPDIAFDAVSLQSRSSEPLCSKCVPPTYKVTRDPPFPASDGITRDNVFEDNNVQLGKSYIYNVRAVLSDLQGDLSAPFTYIHSQEFCGNGLTERSEMCDDGNQHNEDGCNRECQVEADYKCEGSPSLCWRDVKLEDLACNSRFTNDANGCGHFVPLSFSDQWASMATPIGKHLNCKSHLLLTGPPPAGYDCTRMLSPGTPAWLPCETTFTTSYDSYLIKFFFETPAVATAVIIHILADGSLAAEEKSSSITVSLIDTEGEEHNNIASVWSVACWKSPIVVTLFQDLTKPFFRTQAVILKLSNRHVSIAAVRLRTFASFDPVALTTGCPSKLYNTGTKQCVSSTQVTKCPALAIKHANVSCEGLNEGDKCSVDCEHGYVASNMTASTTCVEGQWTPSISCMVITCDRPQVAMGYAVCPSGHHFSSVCDVACNPPSRLVGNGTMIKCTDNGSWTKSRAQCDVRCPPTSSLFAEDVEDSCTGSQVIGTRCKIRCLTGYYLQGAEDTKIRRAKPVCLPNGTWDVQCVRISCPLLPPVWAGLYSCSDGEYSGSICTAVCPRSKAKSVVMCNSLGQWNSSFDACSISEVVCPPIARTDLDLVCMGNTTGSLCRASCTNPDLTLHEEITAENSVKVMPFRKKLQCTSLGAWLPVPDNLICIQSCQQNYAGDGWCDAVNNRAMCGWDGGDCCRSTAKGRRVQPFPETCIGDCVCRDPKAEENMPKSMKTFRIWWKQFAQDHRLLDTPINL